MTQDLKSAIALLKTTLEPDMPPQAADAIVKVVIKMLEDSG